MVRSVPPTTTAILRHEVLTDLVALEALRVEWTALWAECLEATVFQSPTWLLAWWRHFGAGGLRTLVLRDGPRLVGVAPCRLQNRTLSLLGTGLDDYGDVLLAAEHAHTGLECIACWLEETQGEWDDCDFRQLRPDSALLGLPVPDGCDATLLPDEPCLELPLSINGTDTIPDTFVNKLRYELRRLQRTATIVFERAGLENFEELFSAFVRLHGSRWAERAGPDALADETMTAFHTDVAREFLAHDLLRLHALRLNGAIAACCYAFTHRRRVTYYLGGFDPDHERLGLGNQVVLHAIEEAAREGAVTFDFLRGQEGYKYRWGAEDQPTRRLQLHRPSPAASRPV